jgi:hypothetical protein
MANRGIWSISSAGSSGVTTLLNTGATLATATMSAASSTYSNQTNLDLYGDFELNIASYTSTAGCYGAVYIWEAIDGTNFPAQSDADLRASSTQLLCVIPLGSGSTAAQRTVARNILIPPGALQFKVDNQSGGTWPSGWTLRMLAYSYNNNG